MGFVMKSKTSVKKIEDGDGVNAKDG